MSRLLAEWAPQCAVLITWPRPDGDFQADIAAIEACYSAIIAEISGDQLVIVVCHDQALCSGVRRQMQNAGADLTRITLAKVPNNDVWIRDYGPLSVSDNGITRLLDFRFNGWGGKYPHDLDNAVADALSELGVIAVTTRHHDVVMEGGALETDGQGTLLATASSLLNPNRNDAEGTERLYRYLENELGLDRLLILQHGHLEGDDTDGHIDTLVRFADVDTIVYQGCDDPADDHHAGLQAMLEELRALRRRDGQPYRLVPLPWPQAQHDDEAGRLPLSYANYLITNSKVLVPIYQDAADAEALKVLASVFPRRRVVGIDCRPLVRQRGGLHCATMQLHS